MAMHTDIEWADSTLNLQMGCDGCELWNRAAGIKHCYAGTMTDVYKGNRGWPEAFEKPAIFGQRIAQIAKWPDLRDTARPDKPWLNGLPRVVFLNDMGDTFTESLPLDWLAKKEYPQVCPKGHVPPRVQLIDAGTDKPMITCTAAGCMKQWPAQSLLEIMGKTPFIWMMLTKRPGRMKAFSENHPLPANIWPGTSITTQLTTPRLKHLSNVRGGGVKWVSIEPILDHIEIGQHDRHLGLVIVGGESGPQARQTDLSHIESIIVQCKFADVKCFIKQLGSRPFEMIGHDKGMSHQPMKLKDKKGGDMAEWPARFQVREYPWVTI